MIDWRSVSRSVTRKVQKALNQYTQYLVYFREQAMRAQDPEVRMYPEKREFFAMAKAVMEYLATPDNPARPPEAIVGAARKMRYRVTELSYQHFQEGRRLRLYHFPVLEECGGTEAVRRAAKIWDVALSRAFWKWDAAERARRERKEAERRRISVLFFAAPEGPRGKRVRRRPKGLG